MSTEKKIKDSGRLEQIYMMLLIIVFSLLTTIAYFYLNMNGWINTTITNGDFILSASFIVFGLLLYLAQNGDAYEKKRTPFYTLGFVILTIVGLLLHLFFSNTDSIYLVGKGLTILSVFSLLQIFLSWMIKTSVESYVFETTPIITEQESRKVSRNIIAYIIVVIVIPVIMLQQASWTESIMLLISFGLFAMISGLVSYLFMKKKIVLEKQETVDEYRSLVLQTKILGIKNAANKEVSAALLEILQQKRDTLLSNEVRRQELVDLETSKVQLKEEIGELDRKLSAYDVEELNQRKMTTENQMKQTEEFIWAEGYKVEYDAQEKEWTSLQEKLHSIQLELKGKQDALAKNNQTLIALEAEHANLLGQQEYQKEQRVTLSDMIEKHQSELTHEELEDKERTSIQNKIEKLKGKEQRTDENIQQNEKEIGRVTKEQEISEQLIQTLEKVEIPDLTYVITSVQEKMEELVERLENAKRKYADELLANEALTELKQLKYSVEQQLAFVTGLNLERDEKQKIVDIDCLTEIQAIDKKVSDTLNEIAEMYLKDENLQQDVMANKVKLENLSLDKERLFEEIVAKK